MPSTPSKKWFGQILVVMLIVICAMFEKVYSIEPFKQSLHSRFISERSSVINGFDNKIFKYIIRSQNQNKKQLNFAFSAYGIVQMAKAMSVLLGDENERKILRHIHYDKTCESHHRESVSQTGIAIKKSTTLSPTNGNIMVAPPLPPKQMKEAIRIWLDEKTEIESKIMKCNKDIIEKIKITADTVGACNTINHWVSNHTMGMIKDLLQPDSISVNSKIFVTSTVAFQAKWKEPFQKERTILMDFKTYQDGSHSEDENTVRVKTMVGTMKANYYRGDKVEIAELPFTGNKYHMVIILPLHQNKEGITISTTEILRILKSPRMMRKNTRLQVFLPKFKVSSKYQLKEILTSSGFNTLFNSPLEAVQNCKDLRFSDVIHKVVVEVNEEGAKASAGSVGVTSRSFPMQFKVDRAFQFMIRNIEDDVVIFHGNVDRPEW